MRQKFDLITFIKDIDIQLDDAEKIVIDLENSEYRLINNHEEIEFNERKLSSIIYEMHLKITFALEYLDLPILLNEFKLEYDKLKKNITLIEYIPHIGILNNPAISLIKDFKNIINRQFKNINNFENEISILERILRGSGKIISDRKLLPNNESDVQREIYNTLIHVFPDTVREMNITKISKTFKPDLGVKHLKCAIEYKFVDSEKDAKSCIGGIFEDMMGYEGTDDWNIFFAVIYMTDTYMTQDQVEAEFKLSKAKKNWNPIVVYGKGQRINKNKKS